MGNITKKTSAKKAPESMFYDAEGNLWKVDLTTRNVKLVLDRTGVDLLAIAERGDFSTLANSVQSVLNVVFWLCLDQIMEQFNADAWDLQNQERYEFLPEEKRKTKIQKAADWFGERIGGTELVGIVNAWETAIINFIPNERMKKAVQNVMVKTKEYHEARWEEAERLTIEQLGK